MFASIFHLGGGVEVGDGSSPAAVGGESVRCSPMAEGGQRGMRQAEYGRRGAAWMQPKRNTLGQTRSVRLPKVWRQQGRSLEMQRCTCTSERATELVCGCQPYGRIKRRSH